ncbi:MULTISPECIES: TetR/AcrR family transcriptional regulator [unclassified Frigoribacterium]|uniref:TetR/AcrR family transcriptional regulator n=1 Tax=unclassified Frigoribacterium TaxID=2627005 RepID=UPI0015646292|nr:MULTISPECIES: TetR/AcrR family transcriptional regulator [unclassified Frigoribacterium]NQW87694.1 TetR/AcrR family transcriptional regulator [Frigoribacterium sp. VKM Ac-2860]NQX09497.1 TetR/AcrR family transcriptional regulator [Frigoribacterium sp. VKM Ac-2859]
MTSSAPPLGRRERNKQEKLERITRAASDLFSRHGVDEVTTQQIAEAADVGAGTLFLYARTKGELLLLAQNAAYARSLDEGIRASSTATTALDAVVAVLEPIVHCNRAQVENGRTYLREMAFGDATEPHHAEALAIVARTEEAVAGIVARLTSATPSDAAAFAHVVSAVMMLAMSSAVDESVPDDEIVAGVRRQLEVILPR